jgi:putative lipoic acid-binding regulatory protein
MISTRIPASDHPDNGFQFPGTFELSAMGPADAALERELPMLLEQAGIAVLRESVAVRASSAGRYVSVRIAFRAESRAQYDAAHEALRSHPEVKWTI